jgi:hypothetical protein
MEWIPIVFFIYYLIGIFVVSHHFDEFDHDTFLEDLWFMFLMLIFWPFRLMRYLWK